MSPRSCVPRRIDTARAQGPLRRVLLDRAQRFPDMFRSRRGTGGFGGNSRRRYCRRKKRFARNDGRRRRAAGRGYRRGYRCSARSGLRYAGRARRTRCTDGARRALVERRTRYFRATHRASIDGVIGPACCHRWSAIRRRRTRCISGTWGTRQSGRGRIPARCLFPDSRRRTGLQPTSRRDRLERLPCSNSTTIVQSRRPCIGEPIGITILAATRFKIIRLYRQRRFGRTRCLGATRRPLGFASPGRLRPPDGRPLIASTLALRCRRQAERRSIVRGSARRRNAARAPRPEAAKASAGTSRLNLVARCPAT